MGVEPVFNQLESGQPRRNRDVEFNTFRIVFLHEDPIIARDVAQRIANDFINRNIKDRTAITAKSLEFMRDKIDSLSKELAAVEKTIADVKAESVGSLPEEMNANQNALQFATSDLRDAQRIYDAAQSDSAYWKNQALNSADLSTPNDVTSPVYRLRALDLERNSLIARGYTSKHPDMVRIDAELAVLREQMKAHADRRTSRSRSASRMRDPSSGERSSGRWRPPRTWRDSARRLPASRRAWRRRPRWPSGSTP